ncbi:MAG TPA: tRNA epoxyqueuosine(34) reductase QueG [Blastocatellia bacterium]|nr:tRNA epoxyqueuosine(34) reductase QueG [Blastocatellia bacterium]
MTGIVTKLKDSARGLGFEVVGITSVEPLAPDDAAFRAWIENGFAADMDYMTRRPELHTNPRALVPAAASLITVAINYYVESPPFEHENRYGRVARYAWGLDYHDIVRGRLMALAASIEKLAGRTLRTRGFVDAVPLLERAAATRAGLGFFGKNTNLLRPRQGSWFFLAELFVDIELPPEDAGISVSCGSCTRCLTACPTDAFAGPYVLDSRRCISYLTIENKGPIPRELRRQMGEWVFGCDVCQEVCPFNRFATDTHWRELAPEAGVGPRLDLVGVLSIRTDEEFRARFRGTPLTRPKRRGLLRNAAVVAANVGCTAAVPALVERVRHDRDPLIRGHALWALSVLDPRRAARLAEQSKRSDPDAFVGEEATRAMERIDG